MRTFLLIYFLLFIPLFGEEDIVVQLTAENPLPPLYLASFEDEQSGFDRAYLDQLEKVLGFDLAHNGSTCVVSKAIGLEQVTKEKGWKNFDPSGWNTLHLHYVVKGKVHNKQLSVTAFSVQKNTIKGLEGIPLTGSLNEDRRTLHHVADSIQEALFQKKGIASSHILYTVRKQAGSNALEWQTDVWEADYDGANVRQITHDGFLCVTPTYVPFKSAGHCKQFVFVSYKIGQPKLFAASVENGAGKRLTLLRGNQLMPAFSPRKDTLAFVSDITGNPELYIQAFSPESGLIGKARQVFSAPTGARASPTFSPDGKKIAFVSNKDGSPRIYALTIPAPEESLKSVKAILLTKQNRDNTCPAWSPDGTKIAYSALTKGVRQIWYYDFTTGKETQLTNGSGHKENPAWAANSLHLLFNSSTENASELFLMNLHQKEALKISQGPGEKRFPVWEP